ncbi:alpha/beta hydrolase fold domain-containing protein [Rhodococcus hoagii]|nr:alpha/beta hydrolase fold domain-containing protein [Prescottella equi]
MLQWDEGRAGVLAARRARPTLQELGVERSRTMLGTSPPAQRARDAQRAVDGSSTGQHGRVPVRISPEGSVSPAPALVWFHGGGMIMGSLESWDHSLGRCRRVGGRRGQRRVPPRSGNTGIRWPTTRAYGAVEWVAAQHVSLGLDPARIAVGGDSAGSLAAATALRARDAGGRRWFSRLGVSRYRAPVAAAVDGRVRGQSLPLRDRCGLDEIPLPGRRPTADDQYGVPALADDLSGLPAAIVVSARFDPLRDGVEEFGVRLRDAGVATALALSGVGHGFLVQVGSFARADTAVAEIGASCVRGSLVHLLSPKRMPPRRRCIRDCVGLHPQESVHRWSVAHAAIHGLPARARGRYRGTVGHRASGRSRRHRRRGGGGACRIRQGSVAADVGVRARRGGVAGTGRGTGQAR